MGSASVLKNAGILSIARFGGDGLNFLLFAILSRELGPGGLGEYALSMTVATLVYYWTTFGLDDLCIKECASRDRQYRSALVGRAVGLQIALALIVTVVLVAFLMCGPSSQGGWLVLLLSSYYVALAVARVLYTPAYARQQMLGQSGVELVCRTSVTAATVALVLGSSLPLSVAFTPFPVGGLVMLAFGAASARSHNGRLLATFSWRPVKQTILAAWPYGAAAIVAALQARVSFIVVGAIQGAAATGLYASAVKFLEAGILPIYFLSASAFPRLSGAREKQEELRFVSDILCRTSLVAGGLLAWLLFFVVPGIVVPILGPSFSGARPVLQAIAVMGVLVAIDFPTHRLMLVADLQQLRVRLIVIAVIANACSAVVLVPLAGVYGAVAGTVIGEVTLTVLSLQSVVARGLAPIGKRVAASYVLGLVAALLAGESVKWWLGGFWTPAVISLVTLAAVWLATGVPGALSSRACHRCSSFFRRCGRSVRSKQMRPWPEVLAQIDGNSASSAAAPGKREQ